MVQGPSQELQDDKEGNGPELKEQAAVSLVDAMINIPVCRLLMKLLLRKLSAFLSVHAFFPGLFPHSELFVWLLSANFCFLCIESPIFNPG